MEAYFRLVEASADDHPYGSWTGGSKASGGRPGNAATDPEARQAGRDEYKAKTRAAEIARLESGAAPSAVVGGERVRVYRIRADRKEVEVVKVGDTILKKVPMSALSDIRDRHDFMKFLTPGNSYAAA